MKKINIDMEINIIRNLTPELVKPQFKGKHPLSGHCYVASEAAYHLYAKDDGYKPFYTKHHGLTHWFLRFV